MSTQAKLLTAEDLLLISEPGKRFELVNGELVEMAAGGLEHGLVEAEILGLIRDHVRRHRLGVVVGAETGFVLSRNPDTVRAPDVAFIAKGRLPGQEARLKFGELAPDLVVEVVSPGDTAQEVDAKAREWLRAGVKAVWAVYSRTRSAVVYGDGDEVRQLSEHETINGGQVLPGFSCQVSDFFDVEP